MPIQSVTPIRSSPAARRVLGLALLLMLTTPLRAQVSKLTAADASSGDEFGNAIDIDGNYAIVGARQADPFGDESGAAYVFVKTDDGWTQQSRLTASDADIRDRFGTSVAISGDYAAVGATSEDEGGDSAGAVYVFKREGESWTEVAKFIASDAAEDDSFGRAVAFDGEYLLVTAPGNDEKADNAGAAYVFLRTDGTWRELSKITAPDAVSGDGFGSAAALEGNLAVIGAAGDNEPNGASGSAYIFERNQASWIQQDKVIARDGTTNDFFGETVDISGDYVIVGMRMDDDDGESSGAAYIYEHIGDEWLQQTKLTASDAAAGDEFGTGVAISGTLAVVGAPGNDDEGDDAGSAYVFMRDGDTWTEVTNLTASDGADGDAFGDAIALSGVSVLIAASKDDHQGTRAGSAYVSTLAAPSAPQLVDPPDEATDVAADVTLSWEDIGGADTYRLQVSTSSTFLPLVVDAPDLTSSSFQLTNLDLGTTYFWRISAANMLGASDWSDVWEFTVAEAPPPPPTGIELEDSEIPAAFRLGPNYPNPFNPITTIPFALPTAARAILKVYDATGVEVQTLVDEQLAAGRYTTTWDGAGLASGVYVVQMRAGDFSQTRKIVLLK